MKLGKLYSKLQNVQQELKMSISFEGEKFPLHSVFAPRDEYIELYSDVPFDENEESEEPITVKEFFEQLKGYEDIDYSITVDLVVGNEDENLHESSLDIVSIGNEVILTV